MLHKLEFTLFRLVQWIVLALPFKSAGRIGSALGAGAYYALGSRRKIAMENLRFAFPGRPDGELRAIIKESFRNYGITLLEFLWFPNFSPTDLANIITIENPQLLTENVALGKGMILLSGHFGNWELIALGVAHLSGIPVTIIVQTQSNS